MFNKLLVATVVMAASSGIAFAGAGYKGERDLKGEMPCPVYQYTTGPYIGFSVGPRVNYTGSPTTYVGIEGTLSLGWGVMLDPSWYLAGELFGADNAELDNWRARGVAPHGSVKSTWTWGGSIIPGYMITDYVLGYIRLGGVSTHFSNQGTNKSGWQVGLGGQTALAPNWDLRGEYVYTGYGSVSGIGKPNADQFNLGVTYKFL
jgi:opacity protein-like surface antigen